MILGRAGSELTPEFAERLGWAFGRDVGRGAITVGWDCRLVSSVYAAAVVRGIRATGVDVIRLGTCPAALWSFGVATLDCSGGVMVTGADAPLDYIGFKVRRKNGSLEDSELDELKKSAAAEPPVGQRSGYFSDRQLLPAYLIFHSELLTRPRGRALKAVIDSANGTASTLVRAAFRGLGEHDYLHAGINGRFPYRHPWVQEERDLAELAEAVRARRADLGFSIDGDSNQLVVLDELGRMLPDERVARTLKRAAHVADIAFEARGNGRYVFTDGNMKYDDAIYSALRFYHAAADQAAPLSRI